MGIFALTVVFSPRIILHKDKSYSSQMILDLYYLPTSGKFRGYEIKIFLCIEI